MTAVKERPILFSGAMVRAILSGAKTQTRRVVKPGPPPCQTGPDAMYSYRHGWRFSGVDYACERDLEVCRYGVPGDRLWARESFQPLLSEGVSWGDSDYKTGYGYAINYVATSPVKEFYDCAHDEAFCDRVTPSIHMPRWASRITLELTDVRVQRVQEISCADAIAEGIHPTANSMTIDCDTESPRDGFRSLWDSINAKRGFGWDKNPWVWALTFRRLP